MASQCEENKLWELAAGYWETVAAAAFSGYPRTSPRAVIHGAVPTGLIADEQHRNLLELERLKTQLISEQRATLLARQQSAELASQNAQLRPQNESLLEVVCDMAKANKDLQAALIAQSQGRICLREVHRGTVSEVVGAQAEVTYETPDGPLKQVYERKQFVRGKLPEEGDAVEAHVIVVVGQASEAQKEPEETSDLPEFRDRGISGTIRI